MKTNLDLDCWESNTHAFNIVLHGSITDANSPEELAEYVKQQILNAF